MENYLTRTCIVKKNGKVVNELHSEGMDAVESLVNDLSTYANRKNFANLKRASVSNSYVTVYGLRFSFTYIDHYESNNETVTYIYDVTYKGDLLNHYRY